MIYSFLLLVIILFWSAQAVALFFKYEPPKSVILFSFLLVAISALKMLIESW